MSLQPRSRCQLMLTIAIVVLFSAGCGGPTPTAVPRIDPSAVTVTWPRDPAFVVFRAEIAGGGDDFAALSQVANCTVYGDNRVVWMDNFDPRDATLLEDRLTDQEVRAFITYVIVGEAIYSYTEQIATRRAAGALVPVAERVEIGVNDTRHTADSLSGWDNGWFERVVRGCQALVNEPVLVAPTAGWLSAREAPFDPAVLLIQWSAETTGISLGAVSSPAWVSGPWVTAIWEGIRTSGGGALYQEGDRTFRLALQIPGVTNGAPPPPAAPS